MQRTKRLVGFRAKQRRLTAVQPHYHRVGIAQDSSRTEARVCIGDAFLQWSVAMVRDSLNALIDR